MLDAENEDGEADVGRRNSENRAAVGVPVTTRRKERELAWKLDRREEL